jgi:hypothetical protein
VLLEYIEKGPAAKLLHPDEFVFAAPIPIATLPVPKVLLNSALRPIATLLHPKVLFMRAQHPTAKLLHPVVLFCNADAPDAKLLQPHVLDLNAENPCAKLLQPVALLRRAQHPIAVLFNPVCVVLPAQQPILTLPLPDVLPNTVPKLVGVAAAPAGRPVNPAPQPKKQRPHISPVPPLTTIQLASTRIRSVVPAPINTVLLHPTGVAILPITVLLQPHVIVHPAHLPIAILKFPQVIAAKDPCPTPTLDEAVAHKTPLNIELHPIATFAFPQTLYPAVHPNAILSDPVIFRNNDSLPIAMLLNPMVF